MQILITELENLITQALETKYEKADAEKIKNVIMFAQLSGKTSHGLARLIGTSTGVLDQNPTGNLQINKISIKSSIIEANGNPGILAAAVAVDEAIKIAQTEKFALVCTKGANSTSGCLSYYLQKIANAGFIGIVMARSSKAIVPFEASEALFGTNPIGFAIPTNGEPLLFDMGTSSISFGAVIKASQTGQTLPPNVALDSRGEITTDPLKVLKGGALLPFDNSYKSSGLAMMVEILSGVMAGSGFIDMHAENGWGNTFMLLSPDLTISKELFQTRMSEFLRRVKQAKTKNGQTVRIPGEKTIQTYNDALQAGSIDIEDALVENIRNYLKSLGK